MNKLNTIINHIKKRTFFERILQYKKHKLFKEYSDFLKSEKEFIEKKISDGLTIRLFRNANLSQELYCYGFEESEVQFFNRYLKPGDYVLDVGANIGLFTLIACEKVSSSGKVFSFEPSPQTYNWLNENISANSLQNVKAIKSALSDRDGVIDFFISSKGFDAFNSIIKPSKGNDYIKESVPTLTLDSFVRLENLENKIAFIKIDVEGFEIPLLTGGQGILSSAFAPDLIIEFTESNTKNAGFTCADLYDKIASLGYKLYDYNKRENKLVAEPRGMSYAKYKNLIATKNIENVQKRIA
jgi:FkbM family methyltransferase